MSEVICGILMLTGGIFMLIAAIGILRMPDLFMRMHANTKAGSLGAGLILLSVAVYYGETPITLRVLATVAFIVVTAPVAAHMIGRAGYLSGVKLWHKTHIDELKGRYDSETCDLSSPSELQVER